MDKQAKTLIKYLIDNGGCSKPVFFSDLDTHAKTLNTSAESLRATVRYLNETGYIDYQKSNKSDRNVSFSLSHKGENWKYFRKKEILNYIAEKWIDFFAAVISVVSLVISVISMISQ